MQLVAPSAQYWQDYHKTRHVAGRCLGCSRKVTKTRWCSVCRKRQRSWQQRARTARLRAGLCTECGKRPASKNHRICATCRRLRSVYYRLHRASILRKSCQVHARLKAEVMQAYGGCCTCCQESRLAFLTIDHVANDGAEHRRLLGLSSRPKFYSWLKRKHWPPGFQVLCFNCNCGRHINGGVCPHQEETPSLRRKVTKTRDSALIPQSEENDDHIRTHINTSQAR